MNNLIKNHKKVYSVKKSSSRNNNNNIIDNKLIRNQRTVTIQRNVDHQLSVADIIDYNLDVIFVGLFSGKKSQSTGHHYSCETNEFYNCLMESGFTNGEKINCVDDQRLPIDFKCGLINLVHRPKHRSKKKLSLTDIIQAIPNLLDKVERYHPKFICFNGKSAYDAFEVYRLQSDQSSLVNNNDKSKRVNEKWGLKPLIIPWNDNSGHTKIFVIMPTSNRASQYQKKDNIIYFKQLKHLVNNLSHNSNNNDNVIDNLDSSDNDNKNLNVSKNILSSTIVPHGEESSPLSRDKNQKSADKYFSSTATPSFPTFISYFSNDDVKITKTSTPITTTESSNHQEKANHNNNIFEYIQQSLINFDNYPIEDINIDKNEISAIRNFSESLAKLSIRGEIGKLYELTVPQNRNKKKYNKLQVKQINSMRALHLIDSIYESVDKEVPYFYTEKQFSLYVPSEICIEEFGYGLCNICGILNSVVTYLSILLVILIIIGHAVKWRQITKIWSSVILAMLITYPAFASGYLLTSNTCISIISFTRLIESFLGKSKTAISFYINGKWKDKNDKESELDSLKRRVTYMEKGVKKNDF
nr:8226_t:CDS:2 [Entrophospora candida]